MVLVLIAAAVVGIRIMETPDDYALWGSVSVAAAAEEKQPQAADETAAPEPQVPESVFNLEETELIDFEKITGYGLPVIAAYGAGYCKPCRKTFPVLRDMHAKVRGRAIMKYIDIQKYAKAASNVSTRKIPVQYFFAADGAPFRPSQTLSAKVRFRYANSTANPQQPERTYHVGELNAAQLTAILEEMGVTPDGEQNGR